MSRLLLCLSVGFDSTLDPTAVAKEYTPERDSSHLFVPMELAGGQVSIMVLGDLHLRAGEARHDWVGVTHSAERIGSTQSEGELSVLTANHLSAP